MDVQKEISLRNAISYCIENNDVNTATNRIMEFIRDEKEAINYTHCCETLKCKEIISFEDWLKDNDYRYASNEYIRYGKKYFYTDLKAKYTIEINNL